MTEIRCTQCNKLAATIQIVNNKPLIKVVTPMGAVWYIEQKVDTGFFCSNPKCGLFGNIQPVKNALVNTVQA